jgi:hypothetical protein
MTSPEVIVKVNLVPSTRGTTTEQPANGQKLPWFKAAARRRQDRDYVPRPDIMDA